MVLSLSAGAVAVAMKVVINFDRIGQNCSVLSPETRMVQVQAGVVTEQLQQFTDEKVCTPSILPRQF